MPVVERWQDLRLVQVAGLILQPRRPFSKATLAGRHMVDHPFRLSVFFFKLSCFNHDCILITFSLKNLLCYFVLEAASFTINLSSLPDSANYSQESRLVSGAWISSSWPSPPEALSQPKPIYFGLRTGISQTYKNSVEFSRSNGPIKNDFLLFHFVVIIFCSQNTLASAFQPCAVLPRNATEINSKNLDEKRPLALSAELGR